MKEKMMEESEDFLLLYFGFIIIRDIVCTYK